MTSLSTAHFTMLSVAIVGGGIIGLISAFLLRQQLPDANITLIAQRLSPHTTSDVAAGVWGPISLDHTPTEDLIRWAEFSFQMLQQFPEAFSRGISPLNMTCISDELLPWLSQWKTILQGYNQLDEGTLHNISNSYGKQYKVGFTFSTYTLESSKLLPSLLQEFLEGGGILQQVHVTSLAELAGKYDAIMNCAGLGTKFLVPDANITPVKGQLVRVHAPWIQEGILDYSSGGHFIIPNQDTVVLGGTAEETWDTSISVDDTHTIVTACTNMVPSLQQAAIVREVVGLRPSRFRVRLERETRTTLNGTAYEVVHNYGHGGAGITLSWGTAKEAVDMVEAILQEKASPTREYKGDSHQKHET